MAGVRLDTFAGFRARTKPYMCLVTCEVMEDSEDPEDPRDLTVYWHEQDIRLTD